MTATAQPLYDLATALALSHGTDEKVAYESVRVINALLSDQVLRAIGDRTSLAPGDVRDHLLAMATFATQGKGEAR